MPMINAQYSPVAGPPADCGGSDRFWISAGATGAVSKTVRATITERASTGRFTDEFPWQDSKAERRLQKAGDDSKHGWCRALFFYDRLLYYRCSLWRKEDHGKQRNRAPCGGGSPPGSRLGWRLWNCWRRRRRERSPNSIARSRTTAGRCSPDTVSPSADAGSCLARARLRRWSPPPTNATCRRRDRKSGV